MNITVNDTKTRRRVKAKVLWLAGASALSLLLLSVVALNLRQYGIFADDADPNLEDVSAEDIGAEDGAGIVPAARESTSGSAWIWRVSMSADSIEVRWSAFDGGDEYSIHRLVRLSDDQPGVEAMTDDNQVHVAEVEGRFADDGVESGTQYWYGLRVLSADGDLLAHGWHSLAAVDDKEPPSAVPGLTATETNEGKVSLSWRKPDENYQLHSYRILRGVAGEEPQQISATYDIEQTSFIDGEPPSSGTVVYEVVARDFHWNSSWPRQVTIDLS